MRKFSASIWTLLLITLVIPSASLAAKEPNSADDALPVPKEPASPKSPTPSSQGPSERRIAFGVGVKISTLGIGGKASLPLSHRSNVRLGFNVFNYGHTFDKDRRSHKGALN